MNRDELLSLADRCEREEPSRELDAAIMAAKLGAGWTVSSANGWVCIPHQEIVEAPEFTESTDAAKSLEPTDAQEIVVRIYPCGAYVRITLANGTPIYCEVLDRPITEAMARSAAALRALAATVPA